MLAQPKHPVGRAVVATLQLLPAADTARHSGEVLACAWTPDGAFLLSAGWDGQLRLWESSAGRAARARGGGLRPWGAGAPAPEGHGGGGGAVEGALTLGDGHSQQLLGQPVVHPRPISCFRFSPHAKSEKHRAELKSLV